MTKMCRLILCCILVPFVGYSNCAQILAIVPSASYSHQESFQVIWRELSLRGHHVTLITTDPINEPALQNLTEIGLPYVYDSQRAMVNETFSGAAAKGQLYFIRKVGAVFRHNSMEVLKSPQVQKLIRKEGGQKFDLVIVELFHPIMYVFAEIYKCPLIVMDPMDAPYRGYEMMGSPVHPVLYPDFALPFIPPLNFFERFVSTFYVLFMKCYAWYELHPHDNYLIKKYFGHNFPTIEELLDRIDLLFVNAEPVLNIIRPLVPSVIQIGGGNHLKEPKALEKDLKKFLDDAPDGVVYFSMGTNVQRTDLEDKIRMMMDVFHELPYRVLWRIKADDVKSNSERIRIVPWVSQQDVLRHPNVKAFITQGGWQSVQEGVYTHTPMIILPFMGEQTNNAKRIASQGVALHLHYKTLTADGFKNAIQEIMANPQYDENIKRVAKLAQDQPMTGLEKAIWWIEYVIRHKGAKHFRSLALDIPAYQYHLLDVMAFCIGVIIVFILIMFGIIKLALRLLKRLVFSKKVKMQ